jgi:hypothetical protein
MIAIYVTLAKSLNGTLYESIMTVFPFCYPVTKRIVSSLGTRFLFVPQTHWMTPPRYFVGTSNLAINVFAVIWSYGSPALVMRPLAPGTCPSCIATSIMMCQDTCYTAVVLQHLHNEGYPCTSYKLWDVGHPTPSSSTYVSTLPCSRPPCVDMLQLSWPYCHRFQ